MKILRTTYHYDPVIETTCPKCGGKVKIGPGYSDTGTDVTWCCDLQFETHQRWELEVWDRSPEKPQIPEFTRIDIKPGDEVICGDASPSAAGEGSK